MTIDIYADASFATHVDSKSHTGYSIYLNGNLIKYRSAKQKLVTTSSTEAELVSLYDAVIAGCEVSTILRELGYKSVTIRAFQDNKSAIEILKSDHLTKNGRHMRVKIEYLREIIT